jgi:hypothetical protein
MSTETVEVTRAGERSGRRVWVARGIALAADAVQVTLMPMFAEGIASPVNAALDLLVGLTLIWLVGWHVVFIPTFIVEALPIADLAPTWTLATWIATRGKSS